MSRATVWCVSQPRHFTSRYPFVSASLAASRDRYSKSIGEALLMVGNAIRMMCRSPKSRAGCHFAAAIGLRSLLEDFAPEIPDYALDMHTMKGKAMGRGLDHFRKEGAKLVPRRQSWTLTRPKPTGCGPRNSRASDGAARSRLKIGLAGLHRWLAVL
jgi:hypothetical protein